MSRSTQPQPVAQKNEETQGAFRSHLLRHPRADDVRSRVIGTRRGPVQVSVTFLVEE